MTNHLTWKAWLVLTGSGLGLLLIYLSQQWTYAAAAGIDAGPNFTFAFNRTVRLLLNDSIFLLVFRVLFTHRPAYLRWAWSLFLIEILVILPVYLVVKLMLEGPTEISSPWLSTIHRMIVNPLLMGILLAACYIQELKTKPRV
ncbi:MAG: hypothetical protein JNJ65_05905 [Cyclobacteriaceae bacterium]|nr:hypothetical protein [Cyclobacteriaceae bacterium]